MAKKENVYFKKRHWKLGTSSTCSPPFAFLSSQKNFDVALASGPPYLLWNPKIKFCPEHRLEEMGITTVWAMKTRSWMNTQPVLWKWTLETGCQSWDLALLSPKQWASLVAQLVKNPPAMQETWVWFLGQEDPLEKGSATYSSIFLGFPGGSNSKESACNVGDLGLITGLGRSPGEWKG